MLFSYDASDPTYTLAPTVGWTSIEMSAGIVSACLPTLLPILRWLIHSVVGTLRGTSVGDSKLTGKGSAFNHELSSGDATLRSKVPDPRGKTKGKPFYRLPDDTDSDTAKGAGNSTVATDTDNLKLRPDTKNFEVTVNTFDSGGDRHEESGDDVPLHRIHVQKELRQSSHLV